MIFVADLTVVGRFLIAEIWQGTFQHLFTISTKGKTYEIITFKMGDLEKPSPEKKRIL